MPGGLEIDDQLNLIGKRSEIGRLGALEYLVDISRLTSERQVIRGVRHQRAKRGRAAWTSPPEDDARSSGRACPFGFPDEQPARLAAKVSNADAAVPAEA